MRIILKSQLEDFWISKFYLNIRALNRESSADGYLIEDPKNKNKQMNMSTK